MCSSDTVREIVFRFICVSLLAAGVQNCCNGRRYNMYIDVMSSNVLETLGRVLTTDPSVLHIEYVFNFWGYNLSIFYETVIC